MKKKSSWRLTSEVIVFFVKEDNKESAEYVYFCPPEKKSYKTSLQKKFKGKSFIEKKINNSDFKIIINSQFDIEIKSNEFLEKDKFYKLSNYSLDKENLGYLLTTLNNNKGVFEDNFEIIFCDSCPDEVRLTCKSLSEYSIYIEELERRLKVEMFRKTKKWIPGHKYESIDGSFYYLGSFFTCRNYFKKSDSLEYSITNDTKLFDEVYLYVEELREDEKNITDVFKNRYISEYNYGIKEFRSIVPVVDSGEFLKDDIKDNPNFDIRDYIPNMILNAEKNLLVVDNNIPVLDFNLKEGSLLDFYYPFIYYSKNNYGIKKEYVDKVLPIVKNTLISAMLKVGLIKDKESFIKSGVNLIIENYFTDNFLMGDKKLNYINQLFNFIFGINFIDNVKSYLGDVNDIINSLEKIDFNTYKLLIDKIGSINDTNTFFARLRVNSFGYYQMSKISISNIINQHKYKNLYIQIKNLLTDSINSGDFNKVSRYTIKNIGTRRNPKTYASIYISLDDILQYMDNMNITVSTDFEKEVQKLQFKGIDIDIDINPNGIGTTVDIE